MKLRYAIALLLLEAAVFLSLPIFLSERLLKPAEIGGGSISIQDSITKQAERLALSIDSKSAGEIRSGQTTLHGCLGKPGFMQVVNELPLEAIPEWGLNTKEVAAGCVVDLAESLIKKEPVDLLAVLELTAARYDTSANFPYHYHPDNVPSGCRITHVVFSVSVKGDVTAMYVATHVEKEVLWVHPFGAGWRAPTPTEQRRIVTERRAVLLGKGLSEE